MIKKLRNYLFTGAVIFIPLFISAVISIWILKLLTNGIIGFMPVYIKENMGWQIITRLISLALLFFTLFILGMFAKIMFLRKLFSFGERLLIKIPLFNTIYTSIKQLSRVFLPEEKTVFNKVVALEYPRKGLYSIGFITSRDKYEIHEKIKRDLISIFIPTSPNPTSGLLVYAPSEDVIELDMTIEEGLKIVISGGTLLPSAAAHS